MSDPTRARRILVTGASGGLGAELLRHWQGRHTVHGLCFQHTRPGLESIDLREPDAILACVQRFQPELIVHTVGLTHVDQCEQDLGLALDVNVRSTLHVRLAAESLGCGLIHISTNDVFAGTEGMYREDELALPLNWYGKTKLMAEEMLYGYPHSLILRFTLLSWYASGKTSFARWLCESLRAGQAVQLFADQFNSPVYVGTLAHWIERLFDARGIYHLGSQRQSRLETGQQLAAAMGLPVELIAPGRVEQAHLRAARPLDVSLDCQRVANDFGLHSTLAQELAALVADCPPDLRDAAIL
ncbi:MAG: SDR family oxidoreductase [Candidatus Sericytochromatia bacterium]